MVDVLFDGTVLWIRTVTPVLGYLLEELQTRKSWEEGNLPSMHAVPEVYVCVSPIVQLPEQGKGFWFCRSAAILTGPQVKLEVSACRCGLLLSFRWLMLRVANPSPGK